MYVDKGADDSNKDAVVAAILAAAEGDDHVATTGASVATALPAKDGCMLAIGGCDTSAAGATSYSALPSVGAEIEVYWEHESKWYRGHVTAIDFDVQESFEVHYVVDGDIGWEDLGGADQWRYPEADQEPAEAGATAGVPGPQAEPEQQQESDPEQQQEEHLEGPEGIPMNAWDQWSRGINATPWDVDARHYKWQRRIANAVSIEVGSSELAMRYYQLFNKFRLVRKLYQPTRAMCKHEIALHEVRAISIGNWFPCRCRRMSTCCMLC